MQKYNLFIRILHWSMAALLISMIGVGYYMTKLDPSINPSKFEIYAIHKSLGISFFILAIIRLTLKTNTHVPHMPYKFKPWEDFLKSLVQKSLYVFFFIIPISGYLGSELGGYDISFFGVKLPHILILNKDLAKSAHSVHSVLPYLVISFIGLHIAGVIKHKYFDNKNIIPRIY